MIKFIYIDWESAIAIVYSISLWLLLFIHVQKQTIWSIWFEFILSALLLHSDSNVIALVVDGKREKVCVLRVWSESKLRRTYITIPLSHYRQRKRNAVQVKFEYHKFIY